MNKLFIFFLVLFSLQSYACIVEIQIKRVDEEEQKKGPLKKTVVVENQYLLDAEKIISIEATDLEYDTAQIVIYSAPTNEVKLRYSKELFDNIRQQFIKCRGK